MTKLLLPIKPEYAEKIASGEKKYEFRKAAPKREVSEILLYVTEPYKAIFMSVEVTDVLIGKTKGVWQKTKRQAGLPYQDYMSYYGDSDAAFAFQLGEVRRFPFSTPQELGLKRAPQGFQYVDDGIAQKHPRGFFFNPDKGELPGVSGYTLHEDTDGLRALYALGDDIPQHGVFLRPTKCYQSSLPLHKTIYCYDLYRDGNRIDEAKTNCDTEYDVLDILDFSRQGKGMKDYKYNSRGGIYKNSIGRTSTRY